MIMLPFRCLFQSPNLQDQFTKTLDLKKVERYYSADVFQCVVTLVGTYEILPRNFLWLMADSAV
jgi:hypothetical protein